MVEGMELKRTSSVSMLAGLTFLVTHLSGCVEPRILRPSLPFDRETTERALRTGKAVIIGQAFKKTVGGDVKYAAGNTIELYPLTPYFSQVLTLLAQRNTFTQVYFDPSLVTFKRTTVADGEGHFKFPNLLPGRYYLGTTITWGIPTGHGIETTGGPAAAIVVVEQDGQTVEVVLQ